MIVLRNKKFAGVGEAQSSMSKYLTDFSADCQAMDTSDQEADNRANIALKMSKRRA